MSEKRGFAVMDEEEQREIASKGGRAAHESGNAHKFDSEEAAEAGRRGGEVVSRDREHMAEIGRKGGKASHHRTPLSITKRQCTITAKRLRPIRPAMRKKASATARWPAATARRAHEHSHGRGGGRGFAAMDPEEQRRDLPRRRTGFAPERPRPRV